jgi:hypothetical protein
LVRAAALAVLAACASGLSAQSTLPRGGVARSTISAQADASSSMPGEWRDAPIYLDLFVPRAHRSSYRALVSPRSLDDALAALAADPNRLSPPGAWLPESLATSDAFGESGPYNRAVLAMLYKGTPVRVARGPRTNGNRVSESWTLLSPYPDARLERLEPGTLLIVARVR